MPASESTLKQIMADVFEVDATSINENASVDTISKWDSFNHMKLVLALEEQFNVTFRAEQTIEMLNYPLIKIALSDHGIVFNT
jgi:acyl carrier protein